MKFFFLHIFTSQSREKQTRNNVRLSLQRMRSVSGEKLTAIDDDFISGIRRRSYFYKLSRIYVEYAVEKFPTFLADTIKGTLHVHSFVLQFTN